MAHVKAMEEENYSVDVLAKKLEEVLDALFLLIGVRRNEVYI